MSLVWKIEKKPWWDVPRYHWIYTHTNPPGVETSNTVTTILTGRCWTHAGAKRRLLQLLNPSDPSLHDLFQ